MAKRLYRITDVHHGAPENFVRAHLEIYGIDHFRPSYRALVFFNDSEVDCNSVSRERGSYAGSFAIFGHASCYGDEGHCSLVTERRRFDLRRSHPLTKAMKRVDVTDGLRRAAEMGPTLEIAIVATTDDEDGMKESEGPLFSCEGLQLVTFQ